MVDGLFCIRRGSIGSNALESALDLVIHALAMLGYGQGGPWHPPY
jgi:hypothetical protein